MFPGVAWQPWIAMGVATGLYPWGPEVHVRAALAEVAAAASADPAQEELAGLAAAASLAPAQEELAEEMLKIGSCQVMPRKEMADAVVLSAFCE